MEKCCDQDSETILIISSYLMLHNLNPGYLYVRATEPGPPGGSARDPLFSFVAAPHMEDPQHLLLRYIRLSWEKSCCHSKTTSCTYPSNQQDINGMLFTLTLRRVSHRARGRVSLWIKSWLWDRRERFVMNCCSSACTEISGTPSANCLC